MTGVSISRETRAQRQTSTEEDDVRTMRERPWEHRVGVRHPQAQGHLETRSGEGHRIVFPGTSEGAWPCRHPDVGPLASRTVR